MLDERQAFEAMRVFLQEFWERNNRDVDLALVLSDIQIEPHGDTHDPAAWSDWLNAVARALAKGGNGED